MKILLLVLITLNAVPAFALDNVFLNDARSKVTTREYPFSMIGRLVSPSNAWCTAELVGPDLVVTAAHCMVDPKTKHIRTGAYQVQFGLIDNQYLVATGVTQIWVGTEDPGAHRAQDWALLRLQKPLGKKLGWFGVKKYDLSKLVGSPVLTLTGFSGDFQSGTSASTESGCSFTRNYAYAGIALHNCDSSRGSSGGPIYLSNYQQDGSVTYELIALNVAEYRDGDKSRKGIAYEDKVANVAIPAGTSFYTKLTEILGE